MAGLLRILLATDFGKAAELARFDSAMLSRAYSVPVDVVHVHPPYPRTSSDDDARSRRELAVWREALLAAGASVGEERVTQGSAAEALIHTAEALDSSLIVIGAGDRASGDAGTGATAATVGRFARQPVWISRPRREPGLARVMVAVDRSAASREALVFASDFCDRFSATPTVVHVVEEPMLTARPDERADLDARLEQVNEFVESTCCSNLLGSLRSASGRADEALRQLAAKEGTDLLILGRTGLAGLRRVFLGGTAERLLRSAPCSLLLTSPAGPRF